MSILAALLACTLIVTDGDTLRCGGERIRLLGIDAPEMKGHCRRGRRCVPGDPIAAARALRRSIVGAVLVRRIGHDHYGRTLAAVSVDGRDLSCGQLAAGHARYVARWDNRRLIARTCPGVVRASGDLR